MILVIRIHGMVNVSQKIEDALFRLRLRRKYSAVLLHATIENLKILKNVRDFIAYGEINKETLLLLIESRAETASNKKINPVEIVESLNKKSLSDLGLKPFFRLHPPRKGIESKRHAGVGKGVLGDNKEKINDLVRRML
mgnify:CR=1 FL=1